MAEVATDAPSWFLGRTILRSYAQVLFSRSPLVGALVALATAFAPRVFVFGLGAVLVATATSIALGFDRDAIAEGVYGYAALLVGLCVGYSFSGLSPAVAALVLAAFFTVIITAALRSWLSFSVLPPLSLPYLAVVYLLLGGGALAGLPIAVPHQASEPLASVLPEALAAWARGIGALFFVPRVDAGLLILAAITLHSRIALLLSALGFAGALALDALVFSLPDPVMLDALGYNSMLTALALGGVFFVPSRASLGFAVLGVLLSGLVSAGSMPAMARLGLPALVIPFNATVLLLLLAMRQRTVNDGPRAVDFLSGTPEENLAFLRNRIARFGAIRELRFRLPFRGTWVCTQGVDGRLTHKGAWRHAFDFEVAGDDGERYRGAGSRLEEWRAYKLPVIAPAAGVVARVVDGVPDNPVGKVNVDQNWGNLVVIRHAPALYSLVAHLSPGSLKVYEGQVVAAGALLGSCGNSGRSDVPHVHFQLQATEVPGAATLPCRFADAVHLADGQALLAVGGLLPVDGGAVRGLEPTDDAQRLVRFPYGAATRFRAEDGRVETIECDLDLLGRSVLRSQERRSTLYFVQDDSLFVAYEVVGPRSRVLEVIAAALARVPLEIDERLRWQDELPAKARRSPLGQALFDFVSPLVTRDSVEITYRQHREGTRLVVEGSTPTAAGERAAVCTKAVFERDVGLIAAEVRLNGRVHTIERCQNEET